VRTLMIAVLFLLPFAAEAIELTPKDSPWKLDIYGVILTNAYWDSSGVVGSDVPLWVVSKSDPRAEDTEFSITARQTRFGFRINAPDVGSAKVGGLLEVSAPACPSGRDVSGTRAPQQMTRPWHSVSQHTSEKRITGYPHSAKKSIHGP